nr:DUF2381 family protein [Myxococcus sp. RHSTA-1-4]
MLSLVAWTAAAQPPSERTVRVRRVPLTGAPVDVRVAPGIPTTLNFDADINPGTVELGDSGHVRVLDVGARSITLTPGTELGEAVALRVRFADACLPLEPVLSLRADAAEVDAQVTAYRDARAPEWLRAQVAELEARNATCQAELAALRERGRATSPAALVLSGQLEKGVQVDRPRCEPAILEGGLACDTERRHLAATWVVVSVRLRNPPGQPVWRPGAAWLVSESTRERFPARMVALEPEAPAPGTEGTVALEFARPPRRPGEVFRVEAREAEGTRHLSVRGVKVQDADRPAPKKDEP